MSRDPERYRRQMANLGVNNPRLAARLDAGELPGFKGPLEGTEHLHPEAAAAVSPPADQPAASPPPPPPASSPVGPRVQVGTYEEPPRERPADPEPAEPTEPGREPAGEPAAGPEPDDAEPRSGGFLSDLAAGFRGDL